MKWYDETIVEKIIDDRIRKYGVIETCTRPEKPLSEMTVKELRKYVTFFCEKGFCDGLFNPLNSEEENKIQVDLNEEFNRRCGEEFISFYNIIDKECNKEKWGGERRYTLLTLTNRKGYRELQSAKGAVELLKIKQNFNILTAELINAIFSIIKNPPYWGFGLERGLYDLDIDNPANEPKLNGMRKNEINAQDNFVESILINN